MNINSLFIQTKLAEKGWKKSTLADESGMSRQSISAILSRGTCSTVNAGKIAKALGVPVEEIAREV